MQNQEINFAFKHTYTIKNERLRKIYTESNPKYTELKSFLDKYLFEFGRENGDAEIRQRTQSESGIGNITENNLRSPILASETSGRISELDKKSSLHEDSEPFGITKFQSEGPEKPYKKNIMSFGNQ